MGNPGKRNLFNTSPVVQPYPVPPAPAPSSIRHQQTLWDQKRWSHSSPKVSWITCSAWVTGKGEQSTGAREGPALPSPSHTGPSHIGAAREKLGTGNTAYPSQDPSARCILRQKSRPFCRVSLFRKKILVSEAAQTPWLLHQGHPSAPLRV